MSTLRTALTELVGIEHPIVGFTPSEHVAAAISRAGGLGVLGCVRFNDPAELDETLTWLDGNTDGRPYGVDVVMPTRGPTEGTAADLDKLIPDEHRAFVERTVVVISSPRPGAASIDMDALTAHFLARCRAVTVLPLRSSFFTCATTWRLCWWSASMAFRVSTARLSSATEQRTAVPLNVQPVDALTTRCPPNARPETLTSVTVCGPVLATVSR